MNANFFIVKCAINSRYKYNHTSAICNRTIKGYALHLINPDRRLKNLSTFSVMRR